MDSLIFILFGGIFFFYLFYFAFRNKINVNDQIFKYSKQVHYSAVGLLLFNLILNYYGYNFRGVWTVKIVMWIFLISSFVIQFKRSSLKLKIEKIYFKILLFSPIALVLSWIVPMFGAFVCYSFMLLFNTYQDKIIYDDSHYKLSYEEGFLKYDYEFEVYRKTFIFEHKIQSVLLNEMNFDKIIKVKEENTFLTIQYVEYGSDELKDTLVSLKK